MPNIDLKCAECGNDFYFSEKDQAFYKEKGFQQPKRCYNCRQARKSNGSQQQQPSQPQQKPAPRGRRYRDDEDDRY